VGPVHGADAGNLGELGARRLLALLLGGNCVAHLCFQAVGTRSAMREEGRFVRVVWGVQYGLLGALRFFAKNENYLKVDLIA
jgi:hypothetical protein